MGSEEMNENELRELAKKSARIQSKEEIYWEEVVRGADQQIEGAEKTLKLHTAVREMALGKLKEAQNENLASNMQ